MNGIIIIIGLVLVTFLPAGLAALFFRRKKIPVRPLYFLAFLAAGVASMLLALVVQSFIPGAGFADSWRSIIKGFFLRVALPEEGARLAVLLAVFFVIKTWCRNTKNTEGFAAAAGLLSGLAFAAVESAVYALVDSATLAHFFLLRIPAVPLHAACGIRCGLAAFHLVSAPREALHRFASALLIHGFFDILLSMGGLRSILAILLALTALASSIKFVRAEEE